MNIWNGPKQSSDGGIKGNGTKLNLKFEEKEMLQCYNQILVNDGRA